MRFADPWALLLLAIAALLAYRRYRIRGSAALRFASLEHAAAIRPTLRQRLCSLPALLRWAAVFFVILALARPQYGMRQVKNLHQGIAIEMLLDISSSMDISMHAGEDNSRLDTAKQVFEEFVTGDGSRLSGRANDLIGMITFARYADTICPLTLGHDALLYFVRGVSIEERENEDGTAIGDALALGAARLQTLEEVLEKQAYQTKDGFEIKSKVLILLTDGENNCGKHLPEEGAALAKKWGIRVHTIAFGERAEMEIVDTPDGPRKVMRSLGADTKSLAKIADMTGGVFRTANDADSLRAVYEEIDAMEKSGIETQRYVDYEDRYAFFIAAAMLCLALAVFLGSTVLRRIP